VCAQYGRDSRAVQAYEAHISRGFKSPSLPANTDMKGSEEVDKVMFCNLKRAREKVIAEITYQGKHYSEQNKFFDELWRAMRKSFYEENNTSSATFILERFLDVLPLHKINKQAFINVIEEAYKGIK
jgi:hypothetical protein